ncbi:uncharacterized protein VTP21DRAFT_9988 [Calcarisporiella thermophila]|uniref:uncharacterized protein n=1 Tax=Calcarisporiella thermophila TaxID=911321 RepID=UPI0037426933
MNASAITSEVTVMFICDCFNNFIKFYSVLILTLNMPKPKSARTKSKHSKSTRRSSDEVIKYGRLSRKQKEMLYEYGELNPRDLDDDEDGDGLSSKVEKFRRKVDESELDLERKRGVSNIEEEEEGDSEEDPYEKPSAYSKLVGMLQRNSKHKEFYKRRRLEEEGMEDYEEEGEEVEEEIEEPEYNGEDIGEDELEDIQSDELPEGDGEEDEDQIADHSEEEKQEQIEYDEKSEEEEDDDEKADLEDEYYRHFGDENMEFLNQGIQMVEDKQWKTSAKENHPVLEQVIANTREECDFEKPAKGNLDSLKIKKRLQESWKKANADLVQDSASNFFTPLQNELFQHINQYRDIIYSNRTHKMASALRNIYALHAVNHIFKTRDRVLKNNQRIARAQAEDKDIEEVRDQGFTRPKVLILLPFRNAAVELMKTLIALSGSEQQEQKSRFFNEYGIDPEDEKMDPNKPEDYIANFAGNIDDHFRIGVKFTRKTMKLYSEFYSADMIIASPLGLRTIIGTEGEKKRDFDFLSSIELVILDQCDSFLMQNWDHVEHIFELLNLVPKDAHGCDFSRVKSWYLDGRAKYLRQTLIFSDYLAPEINALFNKHCKNVAGKLKIRKLYTGTIADVIPQLQQIFTRIDCPSIADEPDIRFKHFIEKVLPSLRNSAIAQKHTMIFVPSYFDYVRLRNYFEDNAYSYAAICEYSSNSDVSRARSRFFHGQKSFLLYTERFHFFRRYNIRGVHHVVFYALPEHPQFYSEIVNFVTLNPSEESFTCSALFSKYDMLRLERVVGTQRARRMCAGKNVFMFS